MALSILHHRTRWSRARAGGLLLVARALSEKGALPPGVEDPDVFRGARSGHFISEDNSPWQEIYAKQLDSSVRPTAPASGG
jgi:phthalate 4,5-dioxygenase oxygenase subunit